MKIREGTTMWSKPAEKNGPHLGVLRSGSARYKPAGFFPGTLCKRVCKQRFPASSNECTCVGSASGRTGSGLLFYLSIKYLGVPVNDRGMTRRKVSTKEEQPAERRVMLVPKISGAQNCSVLLFSVISLEHLRAAGEVPGRLAARTAVN